MKTLFVCSANVWRSQMAEWYFNHFSFSDNWCSAALIEDRREKYNHKPAPSVIDVMKEDRVDISSQQIKLLSKDVCDKSDRIILLNSNMDQESEFMLDWKDPAEFLLENYDDKIQTKEIQDPYWKSDDKIKTIRDEIKSFVLSLL